jgi:4-aminobutyrate aminotransferase-like enzyme
LEDLQEKYTAAGDVRGMGLLQAIEIVEDRQSRTPSAATANRIMEAARENSILIGKGGLYGNVLRISPPLNIGRTDIDEFIGRLDRAFAACTEAVATA